MSQVFVIYSDRDSGAVEPIKHGLRQAGLSVECRATIPVDTENAEEAERKLDRAQCFILVWSMAAAESQPRQPEKLEIRGAIRAWASGRLLLATIDDTSLPVGLRDIARISIGDKTGSGVNQLIERAKAIVNGADTRKESGKPSDGDAPGVPSPAGRRSGRSRHSKRLITGVSAFVVTFVLCLSALFELWHWRPASDLPRFWQRLPGFAGSVHSSSIPESVAPLPLGSEWPLFALLLLVGVMIGLGASWAWIVRARRRPKSLQIVTLMQGAAADGSGQVFISYSHKDVETVDQLVRQIEGMGYSVWIDRQVTGPQRYAKPIVRAIRTSRLVALMCSQNAFSSDNVIREIYVAGDMKKPFIAFQLDPTDFPDEVLYFVSGFPRIPIASVNLERLRTEIARLVVT